MEIEYRQEKSAGSFRWVICGLLFLATSINYMDRQILGILAPNLQKDIGWNDAQYGHIVVAFQAAYAIGLMSFGYLIDRWGTKKGYSLAIFVWSAAAACHAAARSVFGFGVARFALGIGEAGNFPAAVKTVAEWFPKKERALATGLFNSGSNAGAILAPVIVPAVALHYGWQAAFIVLGASGFVWIGLWLLIYNTPVKSKFVSNEERDYIHAEPELTAATGNRVSWGSLFQFRQAWANNLQSVFVSPIWWFYLFWLPKFFSSRYGLSLSHLGPPLVIVYSMSLLGSISGGLLPAVFLKRGASLNVARKLTMLICALMTVPVVFVTYASNVWIATAMIAVAAAGMQGWSANSYTMCSDLFPKRAVGSVVGLGSAFGSVAAMGFAELAGEILQKSNDYRFLFIIAGLSFPAALIVIHLLVPRWEPADLDSVPGNEVATAL